MGWSNYYYSCGELDTQEVHPPTNNSYKLWKKIQKLLPRNNVGNELKLIKQPARNKFFPPPPLEITQSGQWQHLAAKSPLENFSASVEGALGHKSCWRVTGNPKKQRARDGKTVFFFLCIKPAQAADLTMHVWGKSKRLTTKVHGAKLKSEPLSSTGLSLSFHFHSS